MILDYSPVDGLYTLKVETDAERAKYVEEYGLDWSFPTGLLYTPEPYAAASFADFATPAALEQLGWIAREVEKSRAIESNAHFDIPQAVKDQGMDLWPFQKADLEYMLKREHSLDADEPGLGKTQVGVIFANEIQARRVLVVCPAQIRYQWIRRIAGDGVDPGWSTMGETYRVPDRTVYAITSSKNGVHDTAAWTVVSYDLARNGGILNALRKGSYDLLILDECQNLKTVEANRSRAIFGGGHDPAYAEALTASAKRVVALSGTPLPNRPREIYNFGRHLCHDAFGFMSQERFEARFNPISERWVERKDGRTVLVKDEKSGRHPELQNRLRANFMTRHLKREVMTQLKYPIYDIVRVEETNAVKAALRAERLLDIDPEGFSGETIDVLGHIAQARRIMGEAMAPQVAAYAKMLCDGGLEKLVIFYWHISVGAILEKALKPYGVKRVDGNTSALAKDALVQEFITSGSCRVIIGNILSLGVGTDGLQKAAAYAIIAEPDWVPANNQQPIDRLDRGGQTRTVQADIMVAPNSIAEKVLVAALRKNQVTHNVLDRRVGK